MYLNDNLYICIYTYLGRQSCRFLCNFEFHITLFLLPWYNIYYDHCHLDISLSHSGYPSTNHHHRPATAAIFSVVQWYSGTVAGCLAGLLACWLACLLPWFARWLPCLLACWLAGLLAGWLACCLAALLPSFLPSLLACLLARWLPCLPPCLLAGWLAGWLACLLAWFARWLPCLLACWLAGLLACLLARWLPSLLACLLACWPACLLACLLPCFPGTPVCGNLAGKKIPRGGRKKIPVKMGYRADWAPLNLDGATWWYPMPPRLAEAADGRNGSQWHD